MSTIIAVLTVLMWPVVALIGYLALAKVVRKLVHFPAPAFVVRLLDNPLRRRLQPPQTVVGWAGVAPGTRVLEVGPGTGTFTVEAARRAGRTAGGRLDAVEIQPAVAVRLRQRLEAAGASNVSVHVASAEELPFPDGTFDLAFMVTVLGEFPDRRRALGEIRRVLKPDGILAVGEFLPDPDYPLPGTVIRWGREAGFEPQARFGGLLHYVQRLRKVPGSCTGARPQ